MIVGERLIARLVQHAGISFELLDSWVAYVKSDACGSREASTYVPRSVSARHCTPKVADCPNRWPVETRGGREC
jgi:hypothetical protein